MNALRNAAGLVFPVLRTGTNTASTTADLEACRTRLDQLQQIRRNTFAVLDPGLILAGTREIGLLTLQDRNNLEAIVDRRIFLLETAIMTGVPMDLTRDDLVPIDPAQPTLGLGDHRTPLLVAYRQAMHEHGSLGPIFALSDEERAQLDRVLQREIIRSELFANDNSDADLAEYLYEQWNTADGIEAGVEWVAPPPIEFTFQGQNPGFLPMDYYGMLAALPTLPNPRQLAQLTAGERMQFRLIEEDRNPSREPQSPLQADAHHLARQLQAHGDVALPASLVPAAATDDVRTTAARMDTDLHDLTDRLQALGRDLYYQVMNHGLVLFPEPGRVDVAVEGFEARDALARHQQGRILGALVQAFTHTRPDPFGYTLVRNVEPDSVPSSPVRGPLLALETTQVTEEDLEGEDNMCGMCHEDYAVGEEWSKLPCTHRFHKDCVTPWLNEYSQDGRCPYRCEPPQ
ncbi:unnamed protein product [Zymoseptoria tritici ST99CH_3D7]|uniref:RING-type E3 ubiquitin transferase n=1 Tax=Zymoseptoria tritici (strain ST99CH_3D7) TaxID=1276538 RepID=A0A1X7S9G2_ZYMT9|nr:unnamed protein product [Zymoseptoria tritici ST99CH_3D7]